MDDKRDGKYDKTLVKKISYRLFDTRYTYYSTDISDRIRSTVMQHLLEENIALTTPKQLAGNEFRHIFLSRNIQESCLISNTTREGGYTFPLYLYPDPDKPDAFSDGERKPNLNMEIVEQIEKDLKLAFIPEEGIVVDLAAGYEGTFTPLDLLDYIYAILHSPEYRETYKEFLKTDFPRVPYPKNRETFYQLIELGREIRELHLMDKKGSSGVSYPNDGTNEITRRMRQSDYEITDKENNLGRVWINDEQYFENVPLIAWEFYIGGYQPAQKWLKDRIGRTLSFDDLSHYQNIIHALVETDRLMKEIDKIGVI